LNHETKTTSWNPPAPTLKSEHPHQETINAVGTHKRKLASDADSEPEVVLQEFLLPQTTAIKFEADASPKPTASSRLAQSRHNSGHKKKQSYDHTDG